jgi:hypothetical protein
MRVQPPTSTYLPADLQDRHRALLDEAKSGAIRVRDQDGTSMLLLPEARVRALQEVATAAVNLAKVERVLESQAIDASAPREFGEWAWLEVFDSEDLREFVDDIREAISFGAREESSAQLDQELRAWRITAHRAEDPERRAILLGPFSEDDFIEVSRPEARPHP